jgi:hypothetical protein
VGVLCVRRGATGWDCAVGCYCYDRVYVHRGTVIQLKQEVSEIYRFRHCSWGGVKLNVTVDVPK